MTRAYDVRITGNVEKEFNLLAEDMDAAQRTVAGILLETDLIAECDSDFEHMKIHINERFPEEKTPCNNPTEKTKPEGNRTMENREPLKEMPQAGAEGPINIVTWNKKFREAGAKNKSISYEKPLVIDPEWDDEVSEGSIEDMETDSCRTCEYYCPAHDLCMYGDDVL